MTARVRNRRHKARVAAQLRASARLRDASDAEIIERMERGLPARSHAEVEARAPYERLIARIRQLDDIEPAPGWEERAVARYLRERSSRV